MSSNRKARTEHHVLPDGADPCVWMSAGQIAYKLCDRAFRCEECPLDAALRGQGRSRPGTSEGPGDVVTGLEFPGDRFYGPSHTWAGVVGDRRIRIGLDAFAAGLLRHATRVVLPPAGGAVDRGRVACWVMDERATVAVKSPVDGRVARVNARLHARPALAAESPYGDGWLLEVECEDAAEAVEGLSGPAEARERARADADRIRDVALASPREASAPVGPTLQDGGEPVFDLKRALGAARYYGLVVRLLG